MSYCRLGPDSDVYIFEHADGGWMCCLCPLSQTLRPSGPRFGTRQEILDHLRKHQEAGHIVPQYAIDELLEEIEAERD